MSAVISVHMQFSKVSADLKETLKSNSDDIHVLNILFDKLNSIDYSRQVLVTLKECNAIIEDICVYVKPPQSALAAKAVHLVNNFIKKQNIILTSEIAERILYWVMEMIQGCSEVVLVDLMQHAFNVLKGKIPVNRKLKEALLSTDGFLSNLIETPSRVSRKLSPTGEEYFTMRLIAVKCLQILTPLCDASDACEAQLLQNICDVLVKLIYKGQEKSCDDYVYCKTLIYSLRTLSQIYLHNYNSLDIKLEELMGICVHLMSYGLEPKTLIQKLAPSQQSRAELPMPVVRKKADCKKPKKRKQKINAIEHLKKDTRINDRNLDQSIDSFSGRGYQQFYPEFPELSKCGFRSESDASDAECGPAVFALEGRVREHACTLIVVLVKESDKREMFGYWAHLLPTSPCEGRRTLVDVVARDPSHVARQAALSVLLALLIGSKPYLHHAEYRDRDTPFTPFSVSLGRICVIAHETICRAISQATNAAAATLALRCACAALTNLPYHKLQNGLLPPLIKTLRRFLVHKDTNIQVTALSVIGCLVSIDPPIDDIMTSITKDELTNMKKVIQEACDINKKFGQIELKEKDENEGMDNKDVIEVGREEDISDNNCKPETDKNVSGIDVKISETENCDLDEYYEEDEIFFEHSTVEGELGCWVIDLCLKNLGFVVKNGELTKCLPSSVPVMLESLQVLSALSTFHFDKMIRNRVEMLTTVIMELLRCEQPQVDLRVVRLYASLAEAIVKSEQNSTVQLQSGLIFWKSLLDGPLTNLTQVQENIPALCDGFAHVGESVYSKLSRHHQILMVSLLLGWCSDAEQTCTNTENLRDLEIAGNRRGAAVRALGHLVLYRPLREDMCFIMDCGDCALRVLSDVTMTSRARASYTLAALTDALNLNRNDGDMEEVQPEFLLKLLDGAVKSCKDNDKVKINLVRAVGNLTKLICEEHLAKPHTLELLRSAVNVLILNAKSCNNMKVRWNACYALGNALSNDSIYTIKELRETTLATLSNQMIDCKNIKVRIKAAAALRCIRRLKNKMATEFSRDVVKAFDSVAKAMESALNLHHFSEFMHRDNLLEQLCLTFSHLVCLLLPENLPELSDTLSFYSESIKETFRSVLSRAPPEHEVCTRSVQAAGHVTCLTPCQALSDNSGLCQVLTMLHDVLVWEG